VLRQAEDDAGLPDCVGKRQRVLQAMRERLVADHMDLLLGEGARRRRMHMVRRDDRDDVDAVGSLRLRLRHLGKARIGAVRRDMQLGCAGTRPLRIGRQSSRDELKAVVEPRGDAVDRADEGALSAADHAQAQPAP